MKYQLKTISTLLVLASMLSLSGVAYAGTLDLDEGNMVKGTYIIQDGVAYKIVYRTATYFNGDALKRIVVENADEIEALESTIDATASGIDSNKQYVIAMSVKRGELSSEVNKLRSVFEIVEQQFNQSSEKLTAIKQRQEELKNAISANILVSEFNYKTALVVFVVLLVIVALFKGRDVISGRPERSTKGELELVSQEIKSSPDKAHEKK